MAEKTSVRKPLICANWKMNLNHFEAIQSVQKLYWSLKAEDYRAADVVVHPPFTDIRSVQTVLEADSIPIALGAQDCHWEDKGPFTGQVSPAMLMKLNVAYVIAGHSERRALGETNEQVGLKVAAILRNGMTPILCTGETTAEREAGRAEEVVRDQIAAGIAKVKKEDASKLVVTYEPVWAIGTGKAAPAADVGFMCKMVRDALAAKFGNDAAKGIRVLYGGSVKAGTAAELLAESDVEGLLVGEASLDPEEFARIVATVRQ